MMNILEATDRKQILRAAANPPAAIRQRLQSAADELNRAGQVAAHVELANEVLCKFAALLYTKDTDGTFANVDQITGRMLICAPWGSSGWKRWGMRQWEARILRAVLLARINGKSNNRPLFDYGNQVWFLNRANYRSIGQAIHYLEVEPITVAEWRSQTKVYLESESERKRTPGGK